MDGLRALAIASVVAFHYGHLSGGFLGVDLFFVLSGFLITRVLLARRDEAGSFTLRWFWFRRARRLFPAVLVLLLVVEWWVHRISSSSLVRLTHGQGRAALIYGSNWYNIFVHLGYWDVGLNQTPLNHLWSLSIEEQFYVLWPLLALLFLNRWYRPRALGGIALGLAAISYAVGPVVARADGFNAAYLGTGTRAGALLLGCAAALLSWRRLGSTPAPRSGPVGAVANLIALACAGTLGWFWVTAGLDGQLFHGVLALCGVSATLLILSVALNPTRTAARVLAFKPLVYVGKRSYSLYLWHFPVLVLVSEQRTQLQGIPLLVARVVLTAVATELSYRAIENPIRRSAIRPGTLVRGVAVAAVAVTVLTFWTPVYASLTPTVNEAFAKGPVPAAAANLRLMVVGDSWGEHTALGLTSMVAPKPAKVYSEALGSCGIADPTREQDRFGKIFEPSAKCLDWPTRWRNTLTTQQPDATLMVLGNWDQAPQEFDHSGSFVRACNHTYKTRYAHQLDEALTVLTATHVPVYMTNVIDLSGVLRQSSDCMNDLLTEAAIRNASRGVHLLNLRGLLCPNDKCPAVIGGKQVYDETGHLALETQVGVCAWELEQLLKTTEPK